jgi:hypothetical protein
MRWTNSRITACFSASGAETRTGQACVASVFAANPSAPLAQDSDVFTLTSAAKGALQLAAGCARLQPGDLGDDLAADDLQRGDVPDVRHGADGGMEAQLGQVA